jgi:hypothetical protein
VNTEQGIQNIKLINNSSANKQILNHFYIPCSVFDIHLNKKSCAGEPSQLFCLQSKSKGYLIWIKTYVKISIVK